MRIAASQESEFDSVCYRTIQERINRGRKASGANREANGDTSASETPALRCFRDCILRKTTNSFLGAMGHGDKRGQLVQSAQAALYQVEPERLHCSTCSLHRRTAQVLPSKSLVEISAQRDAGLVYGRSCRCWRRIPRRKEQPVADFIFLDAHGGPGRRFPSRSSQSGADGASCRHSAITVHGTHAR